MPLSHDQFLVEILMMLFLVTVWCCLPVNYLLSSLCYWFSLVTDWFKPVLHKYLLFHYNQEKMIFSICQAILIQTETNIVLNNSLH